MMTPAALPNKARAASMPDVRWDTCVVSYDDIPNEMSDASEFWGRHTAKATIKNTGLLIRFFFLCVTV